MAFGTYFTKSSLNSLKEVVDIDDTLDDDTLNLFGTRANQRIDTKLAPWADSLPLTGDFLEVAKNASVFFVASLWKAKKENQDLAKFYMTQFDETIDNLIEQLKKQPSTSNRTKRVSVGQDYSTRLLFSQTKKY
jgi:hypothetical protein